MGPRKRSWFESQLGNNIFFCCFLFVFVVFVVIFFLLFYLFFYLLPFQQSANFCIMYKITEGSRYFVLCIEIQYFLVFTPIMLA